MTTRIRENQLKGILIVILFILLTIQAIISRAQPQRPDRDIYKGFIAEFATRSLAVSSNIEKISGTNMTESGGQLGLQYGITGARAKVGLLGYHTSSGSMPGTTRLYTSSLSLNVLPLRLLAHRSFLLEPYITGGVSFDRFHLHGFYVGQEPGQVNYSQAEEPFIGKIRQWNGSAGIGVEIRLRDDVDFVHLFAELRSVRNLAARPAEGSLSGTTLENKTSATVGISFGMVR